MTNPGATRTYELRTETVASIWKDLRLPALLAAVSVIVGLSIIM